MFEIMKKYRVSVVAICVAVSLIVGSVVCFTSLFQGRATQGVIQLSFNGLEAGKAPDGSVFRKSQIKNKKVLANVISKLNLDTTPEELYKKIAIIPIVPDEVAAQLKTTKQASYTPVHEYVPNEYQISIGSYADSGIEPDQAKQIIDTLIEEYTGYFHNKYAKSEIGFILSLDKSIEDYDYMDVVKVIKSHMELLKSSANNMVQKAGYFKGNGENLSFEDIADSATDMINIDLVRVDSLINVYSLSKEKEKLLSILEYKIKNSELAIAENAELSRANVDMLKTVSDNSDINAIAEVMKSKSFMSSLLSTAVKNSYYSYVVKKIVDANIAMEVATTERDYYQNQVDEIVNNTHAPAQIQWATKEVDEDLAKITENMNSLYEKYNNLYDEYLETQINGSISLRGEVGLAGVSKLSILVIMGGFGCIGLAVGVVFGKKKRV